MIDFLAFDDGTGAIRARIDLVGDRMADLLALGDGHPAARRRAARPALPVGPRGRAARRSIPAGSSSWWPPGREARAPGGSRPRAAP